jgi:hypothetical protein
METPRILSAGTQVVVRVAAEEHPAGAVGIIVRAPVDDEHAYRVRFPDGRESSFRRDELTVRKEFQREGLAPGALDEDDLRRHVIYRCVIGSRAYGLEGPGSDTDRRGIYLPPADLEWSLWGVPEQIEDDATQECYWELRKFIVLALKANPNVLECLWTPLVEHATPLAQELLGMRESFLSRLVYQTYNGYVLSQFRKLEQDLRARGAIKWKHAMHLVRLLISGRVALTEGRIPVRVDEHRERLLAIKRGDVPWAEVDAWRLELHKDFDAAFAASKVPERPDYERANAFLVKARRSVT